ncbi:hypothetical protein BJY01DRAFT_250737 [Aspergillus pseudoustus]|uniref:Major facilitator superfamily domain-containing protein n=1 Tax=Aspergillus pseudoustus TaxID=1810923 RepID=A0ABR4JG42_9EURO
MPIEAADDASTTVAKYKVNEPLFLHERGTSLMVQNSCQSIIAAVYVLFAGPIAGATGVGWWYGLGACLSGLALIFAFFLVPDTKYNGPISSFQEAAAKTGDRASSLDDTAMDFVTERPPLDYDRHSQRTLRSDMRLWVDKPQWLKAVRMIKDSTFTMVLFSNVFWAMLLNGLVLGVKVAISAVYSTILVSHPYNWALCDFYSNLTGLNTALSR